MMMMSMMVATVVNGVVVVVLPCTRYYDSYTDISCIYIYIFSIYIYIYACVYLYTYVCSNFSARGYSPLVSDHRRPPNLCRFTDTLLESRRQPKTCPWPPTSFTYP